jgi:hypothetical protein
MNGFNFEERIFVNGTKWTFVQWSGLQHCDKRARIYSYPSYCVLGTNSGIHRSAWSILGPWLATTWLMFSVILQSERKWIRNSQQTYHREGAKHTSTVRFVANHAGMRCTLLYVWWDESTRMLLNPIGRKQTEGPASFMTSFHLN